MSSMPPSDPAVPLLPFDREGFTFRDFERFCLRWIKALADVADAHNHGRPGDGQDGIDIVAELQAGGERSYQCGFRGFRRATCPTKVEPRASPVADQCQCTSSQGSDRVAMRTAT